MTSRGRGGDTNSYVLNKETNRLHCWDTMTENCNTDDIDDANKVSLGTVVQVIKWVKEHGDVRYCEHCMPDENAEGADN